MTDAASEGSGLNELLGLRYPETTADRVVMEFTIGPQHLQPFGIPHGGVYCTVHEAAAVPLVSLAAWQALVDRAHLQPGQKVLVHAGSGGLGRP